MEPGAPKKSAEDYQIAWIAALAIERSAASEMLDETHDEPEDFTRNPTDHNTYKWGRIHQHNVVITSLPAQNYGKANAAHTVTELLASLPHIKFGLLVGIGAGIPSSKHDIRLGDVVVSQPNKTHGGVVQYDLGKANADGTWELKGVLQAPPILLLKALSNLQAEHESGVFRTPEFLSRAMKRNPYWAQRFGFPARKIDRLFRSKRLCDDSGTKLYTTEGEEVRPERASIEPVIHFGTIASGDTLVKDALTRDEVSRKVSDDCLCLEMEAAGLSSKFPCMVIRGICDYADSHKNDDWQRYASATAAASTKELLVYLPVMDVQQSKHAIELMRLREAVEILDRNLQEHKAEKEDSTIISEICGRVYNCPYVERKDRNPMALPNTCQWFLQHRRFIDFLKLENSRLLWVSADPGCGKSVLAKYLVDDFLKYDKTKIVCYFFFKDDFDDQKLALNAIRSAIHQVLPRLAASLPETLRTMWRDDGMSLFLSLATAWGFLLHVCQYIRQEIFLVLDALDECAVDGRSVLMKLISSWHQTERTSKLKILITSRPYGHIKDTFYEILTKQPTIHLSGENDLEAEQISSEIDIVLQYRIQVLSQKRNLTLDEETYIIKRVASTKHRTYLWAHLTMDIIENTPGLTRGNVKRVLGSLPKTVYQAYEKILSKSADLDKTRILLHVLLVAQRPLSVSEMNMILSVNENFDYKEMTENVEPAIRFKQTVRDLCGLFVVVINEHVYFLHQTAREFLAQPSDEQVNKTRNDLFISNKSFDSWMIDLRASNSHEIVADRCLWFLFTPRSRILNQAFFQYCNDYWHVHFRDYDQWNENSSQVELASEILLTRLTNHHGLLANDSVSAKTPVIAYAVRLGLISVVRYLLISMEQRVLSLSSALWHAFWDYNEIVIGLLLSHGASPNRIDRSLAGMLGEECFTDYSPLDDAIAKGKSNIVRMLLEHGADIKNACNNHPLHRAVVVLVSAEADFLDRFEICTLLVRYGADISHRSKRVPSEWYETPIERLFRLSRMNGCPSYSHAKSVIDLLCSNDQSIDRPIEGGQKSLLDYASECRYCTQVLQEKLAERRAARVRRA